MRPEVKDNVLNLDIGHSLLDIGYSFLKSDGRCWMLDAG
jgi:hypothetical protein